MEPTIHKITKTLYHLQLAGNFLHTDSDTHNSLINDGLTRHCFAMEIDQATSEVNTVIKNIKTKENEGSCKQQSSLFVAVPV